MLDARDADVEALPQVNRFEDVARHSSHRPTFFGRRRTRRRSTMRQYQSVMMSCKRRNGSDMGSQPLCYLRLVAQFVCRAHDANHQERQT